MTLLYPEFAILLFAPLSLWLKNRKQKALLIALTLMIIALMRPVLKEERRQIDVEGTEAIIALDLSYSMRADDIKPSRLEAAKESIKALLHNGERNRYALYGFTTNALILSPPTSDYRLLENGLDAIDEENILTHGTSLKRLLKSVGKRTFAIENLIIFSDGGEEKDLQTLLQLAKEGGIRIIAVGMATPRGAMLHDRYGKVLKNAEGALVVSRLNPILKPLAERSGGVYIDFQGVDRTAAAVADALRSVAEMQTFKKEQTDYYELYWLPLLLALAAILYRFIAIPRRWLLVIPFLASQTDASLLQWHYIDQAKQAYAKGEYAQSARMLERLEHKSVASEFDRALALYRLQKYQSAIRILERLQTHDRILKFKILFLKGNAYAKRGAFEKARNAYMQALILKRDPDLLENMRRILGKKSAKELKPPVYQKKDSKKEGVATQNRKPKSQKQKQGRGKGKRKNVSRPLGYKAYELINKGYIDEKEPW
jgi:Ca-activated chloride channel family protein